MPTSISARPFAYNTGSSIPGTNQVGNLAVEIPTAGFSSTGIDWFNGPNENLGYVIAHPVPSGNQPTPTPGVYASLGFNRTPDFTDASFIWLAEYVASKYSTPQIFTSASEASTWLTNNGFWNSYVVSGTTLIMNLDSTVGLSGSSWIDQTGNGNNATLLGGHGTTTFAGNQVISLNGSTGYIYTTNGLGTSLDTNGFTYEVWAYPTVSSDGTLLGEWGGPIPNGWTDAQLAFVSGNINGGVYPSGNFSGIGYINGPAFTPNNWYNIVMTYDQNNLTLYVNGNSVGSITGTKANSGNTYLSIGIPDGANGYIGGATGWFTGYIGSWKIWNGAISSGNVLSNFNYNKSKYGL